MIPAAGLGFPAPQPGLFTFLHRPVAWQAADSNSLMLFGFASSLGDRTMLVPTPVRRTPTTLAWPKCLLLLPTGFRSAGRWNPEVKLESPPLEEAAWARPAAGRPELTLGRVSAGAARVGNVGLGIGVAEDREAGTSGVWR